MDFAELPRSATWRHEVARVGVETAFLAPRDAGMRIEGCTTGFEAGESWWVEYTIDIDRWGHTIRARVVGRSARGRFERLLESVGVGRWWVDGAVTSGLDGCFDVDLESSALTNAFPVRRLALVPGESSQAPAAYVRALDLRVERLAQRYERLADEDDRLRFDYTAPRFDTHCVIASDRAGMCLEYPGIATRIG
jgi:hypothetical protein